MKTIILLITFLMVSGYPVTVDESELKITKTQDDRLVIADNVWFVNIDGQITELHLTKDVDIDLINQTINLVTEDVIFSDGFDTQSTPD